MCTMPHTVPSIMCGWGVWHRAKHHVRMGHVAHVSGVAHLVGVVQRIVQNNGNVNSEPKYLACEESPICAFY